MSNFQIFISYRRDGGEDLAGRISDRFKGLGYRVFYDIESMRSGAFNTQIYKAIEQCDDILLILPANGLDRCQDENDWVRKEIAYAIKLNKNIIPIMMKNFTFPPVLPAEIDSVRDYEGVDASTKYFDAFIDRIKSLLQCVNPTGNTKPVNEDLSNGIRFINYKLYPQAIACLEKAMQTDLSNPDVYFYEAIAQMGGKRPFLIPKPTINKILEYLTVALTIEEKAVYHYLLAYIKYDYHQLKMIRIDPGYYEELQSAARMGITEADIRALFEVLCTERPGCF